MSSITYHFGGKEGLYLAAADRIAARHCGDPDAAVRRRRRAAAIDPREQAVDWLLRLIDGFAQMMLRPETEIWARFIIREQLDPTEAFDRLYRGAMEPLAETFVAVARAYPHRSRTRRTSCAGAAVLRSGAGAARRPRLGLPGDGHRPDRRGNRHPVARPVARERALHPDGEAGMNRRIIVLIVVAAGLVDRRRRHARLRDLPAPRRRCADPARQCRYPRGRYGVPRRRADQRRSRWRKARRSGRASRSPCSIPRRSTAGSARPMPSLPRPRRNLPSCATAIAARISARPAPRRRGAGSGGE